MKVALAQQKEVADEENAEMYPSTAVFSAVAALTAEEEKKVIEEEDDIDDFDGTFEDESYQVSTFTLYIFILEKKNRLDRTCLHDTDRAYILFIV